MEVGEVEAGEFGVADAAAVEEFEDDAVAFGPGGFGMNSTLFSVDFCEVPEIPSAAEAASSLFAVMARLKPCPFISANESTVRFICSIDGTRGRCLGSFGVATSEAAFCSTWPWRASHLNQERSAARARATEALESPRA